MWCGLDSFQKSLLLRSPQQTCVSTTTAAKVRWTYVMTLNVAKWSITLSISFKISLYVLLYVWYIMLCVNSLFPILCARHFQPEFEKIYWVHKIFYKNPPRSNQIAKILQYWELICQANMILLKVLKDISFAYFTLFSLISCIVLLWSYMSNVKTSERLHKTRSQEVV